MNVVVWCARLPSDPRPDELDSLAQAESVRDALRECGHDAELALLDPDDLGSSVDALLRSKPDVVFQLVEESGDRLALNTLGALVLEALKIPYTGNSAGVMVATTDKPSAKAVMRAAGLPTPDWVPERPRPNLPLEGPGPYLLKPARGDASLGIDEEDLNMAADRAEAVARVKEAPDDPRGLFAERYVHGREFNLSLLQDNGSARVLPVAEMKFLDYPEDRPRIVGYRAKWDPESFDFQNMERRFDLPEQDRELTDQLEELALDCWRRFRLRGYARVDFRVDEEGEPWILEINCNPGIARDAGFAAAGQRAGLDYAELIERVARAAL